MLSILAHAKLRSVVVHTLMLAVLLASFMTGSLPIASAQGVSPYDPTGGTRGVTDAPASFPAASSGSLNYATRWVLNGGYVAAGVGMRNLGRGQIAINGIPAGSTVQAAFLYWNIISLTHTLRNTTGYMDGHPITGILIGTSASPCWSNGYARSYRANVTPWVTPTARTYTLTGFASGRTDGSDPWYSPVTAPLLQGATLVIVYRQPRYPLTAVYLYNGSVTLIGGYSETTIAPLPPFTAFTAYTTYIVADGQSWAPSDDAATFNGNTIPEADFEGTDPKWYGGQYEYGNLWDTQRASTANTAARGFSVGQYIPAGATSAVVQVAGSSDCLTHVAQVLSVSNGTFDTDGDGLRDAWEANGIPGVNLPALGANPFHKDIYLEMDWMADDPYETGNTHQPTAAVTNKLITQFATGSVVNPDGKAGIALHVDISNSIPHSDWLTTTTGCADLFTNMEAIKAANMDAARYQVYHYQLWVHDLCSDSATIPTGTSGIAQSIPGDDSIVSLGSWGEAHGTTRERTGTSMHELGHTLNLRHGFPTGVTPASGGDANDAYSPNHLSIMSYLYQTRGLIKNGTFGLFDYQRWPLPAMNEACLNETKGVGTGPALDPYGLAWRSPTVGSRYDMSPGSANGPVDWNIGSGNAQTCLSFSINNDSDLDFLQATKAEWPLIVYDGGAVGFGAEYGLDANGQRIPVYYINPRFDKELTFKEALKMPLP